ncbi:class A beta-lactamase [Thiotrichales bacterium 19S3-7]|nr:class A beta-lactamase [Thiotrichales bacterium 19S3-7]MCF6802983.1 class A beta-lactamase [Thiotrichales bacterium 19S3-11]
MQKLILLLFLFILPFSLFASEANQLVFQEQIHQLELEYGGKIGITVIDTSNNATLRYHSNDRFPYCSTFKFIVVGAILKQSNHNPNLLTQRIYYTKNDIVNAYSPYTIDNLKQGNSSMSVKALSKAAMYSDTTATNLLIKKLGGNDKVIEFAHSIGNTPFRLDRMEPHINTAIPGDQRDTSTPYAMAYSMQQIALGNVLNKMQKDYFQQWLRLNQTGDQRIRAAAPSNWIVGDKTGTGDYGTTNDVAVLWPPNHKPIIISIYYTQDKKDAKSNNMVLKLAAKVGITALKLLNT